jgi:hypothetical protein
VELRGRIDELVVDPDAALEARVAAKYAPVAPTAAEGDSADDGLTRYATSILVERVTSQNW